MKNFVLLLTLTSNLSAVATEDQNEVKVYSCKYAIKEANETCARMDDPEYGNGDDYFDEKCVRRIMKSYGYKSSDYGLEFPKSEGKPGYNEYVCSNLY